MHHSFFVDFFLRVKGSAQLYFDFFATTFFSGEERVYEKKYIINGSLSHLKSHFLFLYSEKIAFLHRTERSSLQIQVYL